MHPHHAISFTYYKHKYDLRSRFDYFQEKLRLLREKRDEKRRF